MHFCQKSGDDMELSDYIEKLNEYMTDIRDAVVARCSLTDEPIGLDDMISALMTLTGINVENLNDLVTPDDKLQVISDILKTSLNESRELSLIDMPYLIRTYPEAKIGETFYRTLSEAINEANSRDLGATITLLTNVTLNNYSTFFINKPMIIVGEEGRSHRTITANGNVTTLVNLFQADADFTLRNVSVTVKSLGKSSIVNGPANITIDSCILTTNSRCATFFRASADKILKITDSSIQADGLPLYVYQSAGAVNITNSLIVMNNSEGIADDSKSVLYLNKCNNVNLTLTGTSITSTEIGIHAYNTTSVIKLMTDAYNGYSTRISCRDHALFFNASGTFSEIHVSRDVIITSTDDSEIYFSSVCVGRIIKFDENYGQFSDFKLMGSGAEHTSGSGGMALKFYKSNDISYALSWVYTFTYDSAFANTLKTDYDVTEVKEDGYNKYYTITYK